MFYFNAKNIYSKIIEGKKYIRFNDLVVYEHLRKYILVISGLAVLLNYISRIF